VINICPYLAVEKMNTENEIVCGADIHKDFLVATMVSRKGLRLQERFDMNQDGLLAFRSWILDHRCQRVAVESTGSYWYPIFCTLDGHVEFVLANAYQIKNIERKPIDSTQNESRYTALIILSNPPESIRKIIEI